MSPESNQALATLIADSRQQQQLSRETLSGLAGVSVSFIRDAERDPASCSLGKLHQLCEALGLRWQLNQGTVFVWPKRFAVAEGISNSTSFAQSGTTRVAKQVGDE